VDKGLHATVTLGVQYPLTSSLGEFPGLRLALVSDVVVPEAEYCIVYRHLYSASYGVSQQKCFQCISAPRKR